MMTRPDIALCADNRANLFKPAGLLIAGPWNWCARPKPERQKPRRNCAKQLRLDFDTPVHSKKDHHR